MQTPESQQELALKNLDRLESREARMVWAGSVANGALLLAIIGLIGNVPHPNEAAMFFRWPVFWLGVGVFLGGGSGYGYTQMGRLMARSSGAEILARWTKRHFDANDPFAALDSAVNAYVILTAEVVTDADLDIDRTDPVGSLSKLSERYRATGLSTFVKQKAWKKFSDICFVASFSCLALAGGIATICFAMGYRLQA